MEKELNYSDISLLPARCVVDSRRDCDTSVRFGKKTFAMPVYPANMKSVVNEDTCEFLATNKWFYTMHRFGVDNVSFMKRMIDKGLFTSISIGINEDSYLFLDSIVKENLVPDYITLDVANAWSKKSEIMVRHIREQWEDTFLIVGNVATSDAVKDIQEWGVNAIKCGISCGKSCITKLKTGFSRPMISTIWDCCSVAKIPIIADGGIEQHGDIAKAIFAGAHMVMCGFLFSGHEESSGDIIEIDNVMYKEYYGSASQYNKKQYKNVEGKKILVRYKGSMTKLLEELQDDLRSSISYAGGDKLEDLRKSKYILV